METITSIKPLLAVLVSAPGHAHPDLQPKPNVREAWTFVAAAAKFLIIASMLPASPGGIGDRLSPWPRSCRGSPSSSGWTRWGCSSPWWPPLSGSSPPPIPSATCEDLRNTARPRYFCFFALALSATIGVAFSANLLTLYLFYEMLSFATYPLVTHHQDEEARRSGRKYLLYIVGTSIGLVLPAMLICYNLSGTLEFGKQGFLAGTGSSS